MFPRPPVFSPFLPSPSRLVTGSFCWLSLCVPSFTPPGLTVPLVFALTRFIHSVLRNAGSRCATTVHYALLPANCACARCFILCRACAERVRHTARLRICGAKSPCGCVCIYNSFLCSLLCAIIFQLVRMLICSPRLADTSKVGSQPYMAVSRGFIGVFCG